MLVVLAATAAGTLPVHAAAAVTVGPCTDVQIVGLRGSGEPLTDTTLDMGTLIGEIAVRIISRAPHGTTVSTYGIPYPAAGAITVVTDTYWNSVFEGSTELTAYLKAGISACPNTRLVVAGYSQGAQAIDYGVRLRPSVDLRPHRRTGTVRRPTVQSGGTTTSAASTTATTASSARPAPTCSPAGRTASAPGATTATGSARGLAGVISSRTTTRTTTSRAPATGQPGSPPTSSAGRTATVASACRSTSRS